jgi:RHS repeat-associated protein
LGGSASATYTYDGDGERTKMTGNGLFWREPGGPILTKTNLSGGVISDRIYFGGRHVALINPGSTPRYLLQDALGGEHVVTDSSGTVTYDADTLPFGSVVVFSGSSAPSYEFAGMERDDQNSANLDYAMARYYDNRLGRFLIPDPLPWPHWQNGGKDERKRFAEFLTNPQNFNMYSYVRNNPLSSVDPDGLDVYVVVYTTGNSAGDEQLKRAAQTKKDQITSSKGFDPKKDTVIRVPHLCAFCKGGN